MDSTAPLCICAASAEPTSHSSDARLLELTCDAAESFKGMGPNPKQLANDRLTHSMAPIFDSPAPR